MRHEEDGKGKSELEVREETGQLRGEVERECWEMERSSREDGELSG